MQAAGRVGNFFNQELYGPPTQLPWGIAIDCLHRVEQYPCSTFPVETTFFTPLFLYESLSGLLGAATLVWLSTRPRPWLRVGDLAAIMFIWIGGVRFLVEFLRIGNWRISDIPTAQIFGLGFVVLGVAMLYPAPAGRADPGAGRGGGRGARRGDLDEDDEWDALAPDGDVDSDETATDAPAADETAADEPEPTATEVTSPAAPPVKRPPARVRPEALARARGGVREGFDWLGRAPEARASILYRFVRLVARFLLFGVFRFRIETSGQERLPRAATCSSPPRTAAGWTRSSPCTRFPWSRAAGSSGVVRPRSRRAGGSG